MLHVTHSKIAPITCQLGGARKLASELHHALEIQAPPPRLGHDMHRCLFVCVRCCNPNTRHTITIVQQNTNVLTSWDCSSCRARCSSSSRRLATSSWASCFSCSSLSTLLLSPRTADSTAELVAGLLLLLCIAAKRVGESTGTDDVNEA
jgi:hypothetical protein